MQAPFCFRGTFSPHSLRKKKKKTKTTKVCFCRLFRISSSYFKGRQDLGFGSPSNPWEKVDHLLSDVTLATWKDTLSVCPHFAAARYDTGGGGGGGTDSIQGISWVRSQITLWWDVGMRGPVTIWWPYPCFLKRAEERTLLFLSLLLLLIIPILLVGTREPLSSAAIPEAEYSAKQSARSLKRFISIRVWQNNGRKTYSPLPTY